jgi:N-acetylglucosamine-6-phosphate deacetylase
MGLHIEGPWISPEWRGAHDPEHLRLPDSKVAVEWADSRVVRMVTMAPELEGAFATAEALDSAGVVVSAGHSGARFEVAVEALRGPWSSVTHLFNQMSPFHHRAPGLVGAALLSNRPCGVIADGIHVNRSAIELAWRILGPERMFLVTDAMAATGMEPGNYRLGGMTVEVGETARVGDDVLAGSTITMDKSVATLEQSVLAPASDCASRIPAAVLAMQDRGRLEPGLRADMVVVSRPAIVMATWVGGVKVFDKMHD